MGFYAVSQPYNSGLMYRKEYKNELSEEFASHKGERCSQELHVCTIVYVLLPLTTSQ